MNEFVVYQPMHLQVAHIQFLLYIAAGLCFFAALALGGKR